MTTAYGSITISGLTDIADIYFEYSLAIDSANVTNSYPFNQAGELGWTINGESRKIPPTWVSGYKVWVREVKVKTDITTKIYGTPYPDTAVNQTNIDLTALQNKVKKIWSNSSGSYMASGIGNNEVDTTIVSTYGLNAWTSTSGIKLRYNAINLAEFNISDLNFYYPSTSSQQNQAISLGIHNGINSLIFNDFNGNKGMELTASGLYFYNPSTHSASATLSSNGLEIVDGSIHLGSSTTDRVHFSTRDLTSSITINGEERTDWRLYLGDKFGVTKAGYMSASSGKIGGTTIDVNRFYSLVDGTGYSFSNGGEFSITGTDDSYIKMEQTDNDGEIENTLSVQLSKLYMTLGEIYGQDEIINVIEVINDQVTFSQLWEGSSVWLYEKDGNTFDVYEYVNSNNQSEYYYNNNQFANGTYILTSDTIIDAGKDYYIKNNDNEYIEIEEPTGNPHNKGYYELVLPDEDWQKYTGDVSNLTEKLKDGLQSALSFTTDSLQNEQKLLISSGHEKDELETVSIEVDPSFISLIANNEDLTMQFRMNHDALTNTANIQIIDKEEEIFSIEDKNGYVLSTTTGFKAGPLGIFHYKKGLAIGMI